MTMEKTRRFLTNLGFPPGDAHDLPTSSRRFPDGAHYRVEIPSVEGPRVLAAVLEEAQRLSVTVHRVSQGSGILMLTDAEIKDMCRIAREARIEVCLFVGPRAGWDTGAQVLSSAGKNLAARLRGMDQVVYGAEDIRRGCALGIRSVLVADEGLLFLVNEMKKAGELPRDLVVKVSVQVGAANPISVRWMEQLGGTTYNIPTDLSLAQITALRQASAMPFDVYIEAPDDFGGFVRHFEAPEIVRVAAPIYLKLGLRNAPNIYPSGVHLEATAIALARERVHRAAIVVDLVRRYFPEAQLSARGPRDLGVPAEPA